MTAQRPDVAAVLRELKDFQRDTVAAVTGRMFDEADPQRRFLVADEVGLGKTKVARAVVATTVDRLWDDPDVERIDIVYLCSNAQIARQNLRDLDVVGGGSDDRLADRITLLPRALRGIRERKVNLVAFTPGTSLTLGQSAGTVDERALLFVLLARVWGRQLLRRDGARRLMRHRDDLKDETWERELERARSSDLDPVVGPFGAQLDGPLRAEFEELADGRRWRNPSPELRRRSRRLIVDLRLALARACIALLTPDLVILDEFQRFPALLDAEDEDEQAALARMLFAQPGVRVLMLSATPYRMFTQQGRDEEDHFRDFMRTTRFLFDGSSTPGQGRDLGGHLEAVRRGLDRGAPVAELVGHQRAVEQTLRRVMVRTERLAASPDRDGMLRLAPEPERAPLTAADVDSFLHVDGIARQLGSPGVVEYWKSAPYLLQFMDGYALDRDLAARADRSPELRAALGDGQNDLTASAVDAYRALDPGNGRLRWLLDDLDRHSAFDLAWLPPAMPETRPAGAYATPGARAFTKRLIFSGWTVVPRALACLLSYEAERRHRSAETHGGRGPSEGLAFRRARGRPASWPILALLWPGDGLAALGNPLRLARRHGLGLPMDVARLRDLVREEIRGELAPLLGRERADDREDYRWYAVAARALDRYSEVLVAGAPAPWVARDGDPRGHGALDEHIAELLELRVDDLGRPPDRLVEDLADMAIAGPGPVARRGVDRMASRFGWRPSSGARIGSAARLAWATRSVLIGPEISAIIAAGDADVAGFWRLALDHCVNGALGSVVHEYLHLLPAQQRVGPHTPADEGLDRVVVAAEQAMTAPATNLAVRDWTAFSAGTFPMRQHFALRFGQNGGREEHPERVRSAFNSPFRPFVLVSTSVGQEGLDFHHYAHAVVHWNLPSNPVDLEQREGRVHRFENHAVRKNLGAAYGGTVEMIGKPDPWDTAFDTASTARPPGQSEIVPWWVLPGEAKIERLVPVLPMSRDVGRLRRLIDGARRYRMAFGQPRQAELLASLSDRYSAEELEELARELAIDLSPPTIRSSPPEEVT